MESVDVKKRFFSCGEEVARCHIKRQIFEGCDAVNAFYEVLCDTSYKWFCESFCAAVGDEYEKARIENKRAHFERYEYLFEVTLCEGARSKGEMLIGCTARLIRGKSVVDENTERDVWDVSEQIIKKQRRRR